MNKGQGFHEEKDVRSGVREEHRKNALKNQGVSNDNVIIKPLAVDSDVQISSGALKPRNPIQEMQNIRIRYVNPYDFFSEIFQNVNRSAQSPPKTKPDMRIEITPNKLVVWDNAKGIRKDKIEKVFNLGESGWSQGVMTDHNPFGQGFMSFIGLFNKVTVESNDVAAVYDWKRIEDEYKSTGNFDLSNAYSIYKANNVQKYGEGQFKATFELPTEFWNVEDAIREAKKHGKGYVFNSIHINGEPLTGNIFVPPYDAIEIRKNTDTGPALRGWFKPSSYGTLVFYHHNELVGENYEFDHMEGNINVLDNSYGNVIENRKGWQKHSKTYGFILTEKLIKKEARTLALSLIEHGNDSTINKYERFITSYSDYDEYKNHIRFKVVGGGMLKDIKEHIREENPNISESEFNRKMQEIMSSESSLMEAAKEAQLHKERTKTELNKEQKQITEQREELARKQETVEDEIEEEILEEEKSVLEGAEKELLEKRKESTKDERENDKIMKNNKEGYILSDLRQVAFWLPMEDMLKYTTEISSAEYYHFNVVIAHNKFQRELFEKEKKFLHISKLSFVQNLESKIKTVGPKTEEETRIQWVLNTFIQSSKYKNVKIHIADFDVINVLSIPDTKINEREKISAGAYALGKDIYIQRKLGYGNSADGTIKGYFGIKALTPYLKYNDFPLSSKTIGWGDIALFLKVLPLLSHEMAHAAYHTTDNTQEHLEAMTTIIEEFNTIIAEHHGKTVLSKGSSLSPSVKKELHVSDQDIVAVTYFKGSDLDFDTTPTAQKVEKPESYKTGQIVLYKEQMALISDVDKSGQITLEFGGEWVTDYPKNIAPFPIKKNQLYYYEGNTLYIELLDYSSQKIMGRIFATSKDLSPVDIEIRAPFEGLTVYSRKDQSEFIEQVVEATLESNLKKDVYTTYPVMVRYLSWTLPIDRYALQYILENKLNHLIQRTNQKSKGQVVYEWIG